MMRRPVSLLIFALLLALAATQSIPSAYGATRGALTVPPEAIGDDHPASNGTLAAAPHAGTNNLGWTLSVADPSPAPWVVAVSNSGAGTLNWNISGKPTWLRVVPLSGTAPLTVTFTPLTTGLPTGHYAAT